MVKVLTNLRIDEVSAVDSGAGRNVKIVLMKRASEPGATPADTLRAFPNPNSFNACLARQEAEEMAKADHDEDDGSDRNAGGGGGGGGGGASDHALSRLADLAVESQKFSSRAEALDWLISHPNGHAFTRLHKAAATAREQPMTSHTEFVRDVAKRFSIRALCKSMVQDQKSYGLTEPEIVELISEEAQAEFPSLSKAQAFDRAYSDPANAVLRKAINVAKAMPFVADLTPAVVGGEDTRDLSDESEAYAQLQELGRQKWPTATEAQQFTNAISDPKNAALAAKAHVRPRATTHYEFPR
jgi:hypothetical protein